MLPHDISLSMVVLALVTLCFFISTCYSHQLGIVAQTNKNLGKNLKKRFCELYEVDVMSEHEINTEKNHLTNK